MKQEFVSKRRYVEVKVEQIDRLLKFDKNAKSIAKLEGIKARLLKELETIQENEMIDLHENDKVPAEDDDVRERRLEKEEMKRKKEKLAEIVPSVEEKEKIGEIVEIDEKVVEKVENDESLQKVVE